MLEIKNLYQLENTNDIFRKDVVLVKTTFVEKESDIDRSTLLVLMVPFKFYMLIL